MIENPFTMRAIQTFEHDGNEGSQRGAPEPKAKPKNKPQPGNGGGGHHNDNYDWV